jgi:hypothetical protein
VTSVRPALRLGRSAAPNAPVLASPFRGGPRDLGPIRGRSATGVRGLGRPYRADRGCPGLSFVSSDATGGQSAPGQVGSLHRRWWPSPAEYRLACAASHLRSPLGLGQLYSPLRQGPDHPWGLPCSARRTGRRRRAPLCPGGGLSCRWADDRPAPPLHRPLWSAPVSRCGSVDCPRVAGGHPVTHRVLPRARSPGAAPRGQYCATCCTPLRD